MSRPFIIAEVGSNWTTADYCVNSIIAAKVAGADAAKFQAFDHKSLYGVDGTLSGVLPLEWLSRLKETADDVGIEFMCTPFSPALLQAVDPFVKRHKIASSDAAWPQLLKMAKSSGKPIILSTGAKTENEIQRAVDILPLDTTILYCVAAYPAVYADLAIMEDLKAFGREVGFSDHTLGISMAIEAAKQGATVIEKHFTAFPELETPDRPHSIGAIDFRIMVDVIHSQIKPEIGPTSEEIDMLARHNRRLVAIKDIPISSRLDYGVNYGAYRSLVGDSGVSPFDWERVNGRQVKCAILRGECIKLKDIV